MRILGLQLTNFTLYPLLGRVRMGNGFRGNVFSADYSKLFAFDL